LQAWKKKAKEVRQKRVYKTAEEILAEKEASNTGGGPLTTIIDMRGSQARIITNMERLNDAPPEAAEDDTPLPELQYNLRLIVDRTEADIQRLDQKLR
jgi:tuftelin-interacting protein 11